MSSAPVEGRVTLNGLEDLLLLREASAQLVAAFTELGHAGQECVDLEALTAASQVTAEALCILLAAVATVQSELAACDELQQSGLTQIHIARARLAAGQARQMLRGAYVLLVRTGEHLTGPLSRQG